MGIVGLCKQLLHVTAHPRFLGLELRVPMGTYVEQYGSYNSWTLSRVLISENCVINLFPTLTLSQKRKFQQMPDLTPPSPHTFSPDHLSSSLSSPKIVDIPKIPPTPPSQTRKPRLPSEGMRRGESFLGKVSALDQPLPPVPTDNPRASVVSTDSGIGPSAGGEIRRTVSSQRPGSSSVPSSGDGKFCRPLPPSTSTTSKSDGGKFDRLLGVQVEEEGDPEELDNYGWFWGCMSRQDCEKKLQSEGKVGNFVVRINASGNYIMSFWYVWEMALATMNTVFFFMVDHCLY